MRAARGIAAAIVVSTLVLAGCTDEQVSESGGGPSPTTSAQADEPSATASTSNERSGRVAISDGGDEVSFRCAGTGKPVILLEAGDDSGGTQAYGPAIIDPLANHTTTCTYDRPGTGTSDPARGRRRTLASYRTDLSAFLHAAHLRPPYVLVGQSGGGNLLISYAAAHADDVAGLVLIETYHDDPDRLAKEFGPFDPTTAHGEKLDWVANTRVLDNLALPLGDFPVLVMTATDTDPGNKENQAYWLGISPDSRQVVITGSHDLQDDDPARVTNEIIRTLGDIRKAG
jgi:alpha/beta hydrolase fold